MNNEILDQELTKGDEKLIIASKEKRFANYLVDIIFFFLFYMALSLFIPFLIEEKNGILDRITSMIICAIYYTIIETALKGKTLGKFLIRTKTVNLDGSTPDFNTILKRSFSRVVPFDGLSFLGKNSNGWHDKWSNTIVIDEKLSNQ